MGRKQIEYSVRTRTNSPYWYYKIRGMRDYRSTGIKVQWRKGQPANRAEAQRFAEETLREADANAGKEPEPTLGEYAASFYRPNKCPILAAAAHRRPLKESTRRGKRQYLTNYILPKWGGLRPREITGRAIEDWLVSLEWGNSTRNHLLQTFSQILRQAHMDGLCDTNAAASVQGFSQVPEKQNRALIEDEIAALFPEDSESFFRIWHYNRLEWSQSEAQKHPWHGTMFYVKLTTGMRSAEIRALTWGDIRFDKAAIVVSKQIDKDGNIASPKKNEYRAVPLFPRAHSMLYAWYQATRFRESGDYVFTNTGRPLPRHRLSEYLREGCKNAGINEVRPHQFRHTFTTRLSTLFDAGSSSKDLVRLLTGHQSEQMRIHYDHPTHDELIDRMEPANRAAKSIPW